MGNLMPSGQLELCGHQGGLQAPCIASASFASGLGRCRLPVPGTPTPCRFLFVQGFTCALANLKYTSKGICSHQGGLLVQEMASDMAR